MWIMNLRNLAFYTLGVSLFIAVFACSDNKALAVSSNEFNSNEVNSNEVSSQILIAGQHTAVGTVSVSNDDNNLAVLYQTNNGWLIEEAHLDVAASYNDLAVNRAGNPMPGRFRFQKNFDTPQDYALFTIDTTDWPTGTELYIAAHAVVTNGENNETAWAGNFDFPGRNWATYFTYTLQATTQAGTIQFGQATYTVQEGNRDIVLDITVSRVGGSDGEITVEYQTLDGTAIGGATPGTGDYVVSSGTLVFADGDDANQVIHIIISADSADATQFENFTIELSSNDCCLGEPSIATVIIEDNPN